MHLQDIMLFHGKVENKTFLILSITESEYVALGSCYAQVLQITSALQDFGLDYKKVPFSCDNKSDKFKRYRYKTLFYKEPHC